jgi:hypothetical protein
VFDKKAGCELEAVCLGEGKSRIQAASDTDAAARRTVALARGFARLCEMQLLEDERTVQFPCGMDHDPLIGMLMYRAQNVRASLREYESTAGRGVLAPPSQQ